eukprot:793593_1
MLLGQEQVKAYKKKAYTIKLAQHAHAKTTYFLIFDTYGHFHPNQTRFPFDPPPHPHSFDGFYVDLLFAFPIPQITCYPKQYLLSVQYFDPHSLLYHHPHHP